MTAAPFLRVKIEAARLREARHEAGLTQQQVVVRTGLSPRTVALAEAGLASRKTAERLASLLHLRVGDLLGQQVEAPPPPPPHEFQISSPPQEARHAQ